MRQNASGEVRSPAGSRSAVGLTVLGALARLIPHPANFTPVGAMSLFAGARISGWQAYLVPMVLMAVTDSILGYSATVPFIYGSFLLNVWIGRRLLRKANFRRLGPVVLLGSLQFFLLTNAGVWLTGGMYPHTGAGLLACYIAAIPFFGRTLAGDLLYTGVLFGLHAWLKRTAFSFSANLAKNTSSS
ncbi:MAG: hypothetical protein HY647_01885 [Acidobacteria bacterium]|nr:hypothetical protein [Acidobacteriota bacterium]